MKPNDHTLGYLLVFNIFYAFELTIEYFIEKEQENNINLSVLRPAGYSRTWFAFTFRCQIQFPILFPISFSGSYMISIFTSTAISINFHLSTSFPSFALHLLHLSLIGRVSPHSQIALNSRLISKSSGKLPDFWADKGVMLFNMIVYRLCFNKKVL